MSVSAPSATTPKRPPPLPPGRTAAPWAVVDTPAERPKTDWRTVILVNLVSLMVHGLLLGVCALIVLDRDTVEDIFTTLVLNDDAEPEPIVEQSLLQPEKIDGDRDADTLTTNTSTLVADTKALVDLNISDLEPSFAPEDFNFGGANIKPGDHFAGRAAAAKAALVRQFGGNSASEAAVASGLKWLASRQLKDGSWSFDHTECEACANGGCTQPGGLRNCKSGATAMALLAFLGGGHTHQKGDYQNVVKSGLESLIREGNMTEKGLDLRGKVASNEGMYVQGLATITLCETAALTKDPHYSKQAFQAVKFIISAQDPKGGGWRYNLNQAGDTSVVGWQIMALKSAQNGKLKVPPTVFKLADKFLDHVQAEKGAVYGYTDPPKSMAEANPAMTAVGLLCRMYMGWDRKNPHMKKGVEYLDRVKPSPNNMYYNYYATQVMHHYGGDEWKRWNEAMRNHLVNTQLKDGVEVGSWNVTDPHGGPGGRLYQTCLCVMTLEVYYRHLPIYQRDKVKVEY